MISGLTKEEFEKKWKEAHPEYIEPMYGMKLGENPAEYLNRHWPAKEPWKHDPDWDFKEKWYRSGSGSFLLRPVPMALSARWDDIRSFGWFLIFDVDGASPEWCDHIYCDLSECVAVVQELRDGLNGVLFHAGETHE